MFGRTYVFDQAVFETDKHVTLLARPGSAMSRFGKVGNTYVVRPEGDGTRVRVLFEGPWMLAQALSLVNLVMMRKQLRVLKALPNARPATHCGVVAVDVVTS